METFPALLALCGGNPPVIGGFPSQRPVTWSFDVFFDLRLNKQLSKQSKSLWFETPSCSLYWHFNDMDTISQYLTTTKHNKVWTLCIILGIYCTTEPPYISSLCQERHAFHLTHCSQMMPYSIIEIPNLSVPLLESDEFFFNPLCPSNAISHHKTWATLVPAKACYIKPLPGQCCLITSEVLLHFNAQDIYSWHLLENYYNISQ